MLINLNPVSSFRVLVCSKIRIDQLLYKYTEIDSADYTTSIVYRTSGSQPITRPVVVLIALTTDQGQWHCPQSPGQDVPSQQSTVASPAYRRLTASTSQHVPHLPCFASAQQQARAQASFVQAPTAVPPSQHRTPPIQLPAIP